MKAALEKLLAELRIAREIAKEIQATNERYRATLRPSVSVGPVRYTVADFHQAPEALQ